MVQPPTTIIRVCAEHMREIFRECRLIERRDRGEIRTVVNRDQPTDFVDHNGERCVRSQEISWLEEATGTEVARVHQYITDEGAVGASGLPDPKRIRVGQLLYRLHKKGRECSICGEVSGLMEVFDP